MTHTTALVETDPEVLDHLYNNRALVPDSADYLEAWSAESALVRNTTPCQIDVPYGDKEVEKLDVFAHSKIVDAPIFFFIHGGYWRSLDKSDHSFVAPAFVNAGACVVIPNYALCPTVTIPDIIRQIAVALAWTHRHAETLGGDRERITVAGHSAGGHLAAAALTMDWQTFELDLSPMPVKNALAISGVFDLESVMRTPYLQGSLNLTPSQVREASPARLPPPRVLSGRGTLAAVVGAEESAAFLEQNELIGKVWGPVAVPICETLPGLNHFSILKTLVQPGERVHQLANELLLA